MSQRTMPTPLGRCRMGLGRSEITPPANIYHRCWGAASHDAATGIHAPLFATVLIISPENSQAEHLLVTLDLGWLREGELDKLGARVAEETGFDPGRLIITFSHTHAAGNYDLDRIGDEGGNLIPVYLKKLPSLIAEAVEQARTAIEPVEIAYGSGHCDLARNRDYWDHETKQFVCGSNPERESDDTVVVGRVSDKDGRAVAHIVNYACHPTTLAWDNTLVSPDYIGGMRDVVEHGTGVPCLFLLGACGDLGPKDGYVGDTAVAERNGRQLGYAALSAIESLTPPGTEMTYSGPVVSGATIGVWSHEPLPASRIERVDEFVFQKLSLELPFLDLPTREQLSVQLDDWQKREAAARSDGHNDEAADCRAMVERTRRAFRRIEAVIPDGMAPYDILMWSLGEGVAIFVSGEPYNVLQRELRARHPNTPLFVTVLCNHGTGGYLLPKDDYGTGLYQESAAVVGPGALESIIDAISKQLTEWKMT
jgi:hypothetical protein